MGQQVLDIQNAADIVRIVLINRYTTVIVLYDTLQHLSIGALYIQIDNVLTTCHHLLGSLVAKTDNALKHALLVLDIVLVGEFQSLFKLIHTQYMILFLHHLLGKHSTLQKNGFYRPENFTGKENGIHTAATETKRILTAVNLWHDFTKEQQKKSEKHRHDQELKPISLGTELDNADKNITQQHDNHDVDKVVGNQNRC